MQKRGSSLAHIGAALEKALADRSLSEGLVPHRARAHWNEVVGADIAAATRAETVRGGVLFVKVRSSVWANELTFYKTEILRKLNAISGRQTLTDIHFTVASRGPASKDVWPDANTNRTTAQIPIAGATPSTTNGNVPETVADRLQMTRERAAQTYAAKRELGWIECAHCGALFDPAYDGIGSCGVAAPKNCPLCTTLARAAY